MEIKGTGNQEIRKSVDQENREFRNEDFRSFGSSAEFTLSVAERAQGRFSFTQSRLYAGTSRDPRSDRGQACGGRHWAVAVPATAKGY